QRHRSEHCVANCMGSHGHLRVRTFGSSEHPSGAAFSIELAKFRRVMDGAGDHRYRISRCVLFEVRSVSSKLSAAGFGYLCELSQRPRTSGQLLPLLLTWHWHPANEPARPSALSEFAGFVADSAICSTWTP